MTEVQKKTKNTSGFVQMSIVLLQRVSQAGGGYNDLAAYIVLCNGVDGRHAGRLCTHGANSISGRTNMSYRAAAKATEWLEEHGFIRRPNETEPKFLGKTKTRATTIRWAINDQDHLDVAVSKQFIDGVKGSAKNAPLKRMLGDIDGADEIPRSQAVIDSILLFAALMKEQDFADCAGVDPDAWYQEFAPIASGEDGDESEHIVAVQDTNAVMVTVKESDTRHTKSVFMYTALGEMPTDEAHEKYLTVRFWHALHQLKSMKLVYRVMILWSGNPLNHMERKKAEPIATQYINDSWAREVDSHLQYETNRAAWRTRARDVHSDFIGTLNGESLPFIGSGNYRYMVPAKAQKNYHLVGQLRVRYWAGNESTVQGRQIEQTRTEKFSSSIAKLGK